MDRNAAAEGTRRVGIMPMLALCIFTAFALVYGLVDDGGRQAMLPDYPAVADSKGQQSTPVVPKRPLTAAEWRVGKATAPCDDGKAKSFLSACGPLLFAGFRQPAPASGAVHHRVDESSHDYRARAPPEAARRLHIGVAA